MDISALKVNVKPAATSTLAPVIKMASNFQDVSPSITGESAITSEVHSTDKKTEKKLVKIEDIQPMTVAMNQFIQMSNPDMQFIVHQKTNEVMVQFVNTKSGQVLKEFPSHEFLDTIANIREYVGMLLDKHA